MIKFVLVLLTSFSLFGCSNITYVTPKGNETAKLIFKTNTRSMLNVYEESAQCKNPHTALDLPNSSPNGYVYSGEVILDSRFETSLNIIILGQMRMCDVLLSFYPKAGHIYQLDSNLDYGSKKCSLLIKDLNGEKLIATQRLNKKGFLSNTLGAFVAECE